MKGSIEKQAMAEVPGILANFLELPESDVNVVPQQGKIGPDFLGESFRVPFPGGM